MVSAAGLKAGETLLEGWVYRPGDHPAWAEPGLDDSAWEAVNTLLPPDGMPETGWPGIGWFRLRLRPAADLAGATAAFIVLQEGASEVYLDGRLASRVGVVGASEEAEEAYWTPSQPQVLELEPGHDHLLAVRYSNHAGHQKFRNAGFELSLRGLDVAITERDGRTLGKTQEAMFLAGAATAFAVLHLMLFVFFPRSRVAGGEQLLAGVDQADLGRQPLLDQLLLGAQLVLERRDALLDEADGGLGGGPLLTLEVGAQGQAPAAELGRLAVLALELRELGLGLADAVVEVALGDAGDGLSLGDGVALRDLHLEDPAAALGIDLEHAVREDQDTLAVDPGRHAAEDPPGEAGEHHRGQRRQRQPAPAPGDHHELVELLGRGEPLESHLAEDLLLVHARYRAPWNRRLNSSLAAEPREDTL